MPLPRRARLADIQAQQVEVGRIRLGTTETKTSRAGKEYQSPVKLERFRLTSRSQKLIEEAAALYGGEMEPWEKQWQVITEAMSLPVIVPADPLSQYYEQWTAGRCTRRCDGLRELLEEQPCPCGPDPSDKKAQGCKPTTRVALMLAEMSGMGVWRLETRGYHAAAELPAMVDLLTMAGGNLPARLEMEERQAQIPDPRGGDKTVTSRFMVPVLHVEATPRAILGVITGPPGGRNAPGLPAAGAAPAVGGGAVTAVAAIGSGPTSAVVSAPPAPPPAALPATDWRETPGDDLPDEVKAAQWRAHAWYEEKLVAESDPRGLEKWAANIRGSEKLHPQWRDNLLQMVADRIVILADTAPPPAPAESYAGQPVVVANVIDPPAAPAADRGAVWNQVTTLAGERGWTISKLKADYKEYQHSDITASVSTATAADLQGFLAWLGAR